MSKKIFRRYMCLLMIISIILSSTGCKRKPTQEDVQRNFDNFINELFVQQVQSDSISLNYSLSAPENFGIELKDPTLGEYTAESMYESVALTENTLDRLNRFNIDLLTEDQQLIYKILQEYMENNLSFGDYIYYSESLGPTTGIQAQLPILLAEFKFYTKEDIDRYIGLLPSVYDYFKDITEFEKEKSERGLFMSDAVADSIISQCEAFIDEPEDNFLIDHFNQKISEYPGLSDSEILSYNEANKYGIINHVIPAYELLIECLEELKGTGKNAAGLYYFPEGQSYYEYVVKSLTGSDKEIDQLADMLESAINDSLLDITTSSLIDSTFIDKYNEFESFPLTDPEAILFDLKKDIKKDFPDTVQVNCDIKYVPESLSEFLSPAMYLIPAIDDYTNNNIYINGNDAETLSMIYTTIAHEGYPGHLYQNVYFRNQNPAPIRNVLNFTGYDEGWATYVELYSYDYAGIDESLADFFRTNTIITLGVYARADIGIHYDGWTEKRAVAYISNYVGDKEISKTIYETLLQEPAIYLPYAIGCLEIQNHRASAEALLGDQFDAKDFHQFLLDIGPAPFSVIEDYFYVWIEEQK